MTDGEKLSKADRAERRESELKAKLATASRDKARLANPAWPHWRRAKLSLERIATIAESGGATDQGGQTEGLVLAIREWIGIIEKHVDGMNPGQAPEKKE